MTCIICHSPVHWVDSEQRWYHDSLTDILSCPATDIVAEDAGATA